MSAVLPPCLPPACSVALLPAFTCCTRTQVSTPDKRRDLLSHSLLKSYQTQASAHGSGTDLTVGLLVPQVRHDQADRQQQAVNFCGLLEPPCVRSAPVTVAGLDCAAP